MHVVYLPKFSAFIFFVAAVAIEFKLATAAAAASVWELLKTPPPLAMVPTTGCDWADEAVIELTYPDNDAYELFRRLVLI